MITRGRENISEVWGSQQKPSHQSSSHIPIGAQVPCLGALAQAWADSACPIHHMFSALTTSNPWDFLITTCSSAYPLMTISTPCLGMSFFTCLQPHFGAFFPALTCSGKVSQLTDNSVSAVSQGYITQIMLSSDRFHVERDSIYIMLHYPIIKSQTEIKPKFKIYFEHFWG